MPLPTTLQPLVRTRQFWTDYFWETEADEHPYPELEGCTLDLPVAGGFGLSLSLDPVLGYFSLGLTSPGNEPVQIAWDDQAHWHPHVLRWQELEVIGRAIAVQDAGLAHPGIVLLLLHRFAPICQGDDLDAILPMLDCAWRQLGMFSDPEIVAFIERADARDAGFRWRYHESVGGWCLEQDDEDAARGLYTLRHPENAEFPFGPWSHMLTEAQHVLARAGGPAGDSARAFAESGDMAVVPEIVRSLRAGSHASLADALGEAPPPERVCWVVETLLGMEPGSLLKRHAPPRIAPREKHSLELTLPLRDPTRPLPESAGYLIVTSLGRILRDCNLGRAEPGGRTSTRGGDGSFITTEESLSIHLKGDLDRGVAIVRDVLWWAGAPESVRLSRRWRETIPLELARPAADPGEVCFRVGGLHTVQWRYEGKQCYRFDPVPFSEASRRLLRAVLADAGADGPDMDGWFAVNLPDGGSIRLCFRRLDDDPDLDGGTVAVRRWSADAAEFLYRLLQRTEFMLLPMAVATSAATARTVAAPWPRVRVVESTSDLHRLIARGPYDWWINQAGPGSPPAEGSVIRPE